MWALFVVGGLRCPQAHEFRLSDGVPRDDNEMRQLLQRLVAPYCGKNAARRCIACETHTHPRSIRRRRRRKDEGEIVREGYEAKRGQKQRGEVGQTRTPAERPERGTAVKRTCATVLGGVVEYTASRRCTGAQCWCREHRPTSTKMSVQCNLKSILPPPM